MQALDHPAQLRLPVKQKMLKAYTAIAQALSDSKDLKDQELAQQLQNRLAMQGHPIKLRMGGAAPKPSM
jgi:hypothetical protein